MSDEIIREVWQIKDATAEKYNHDLGLMANELQNRERNSSAKVVNLRAQRPSKAHVAESKLPNDLYGGNGK